MTLDPVATPLQVLVVEDNTSDRWLYGEILEARGHTPRPVDDAEGAWALLQHEVFPLILLDLGLPGSMGGLELCRRIRSLPEGDRPIILVVTGHTEPRALDEALAAGADDYLQKPVDVALLGVRLAVAERSVRRRQEWWEAQAELEDASRRLEGLFASLGDVVFSVELEPDRLLYVSRASRQVLGVRPEALHAQGEWQGLLLPAQARARILGSPDGASGAGDPGPVVLSYPVMLPGGEVRRVQATYRPDPPQAGRPRRVDGVISALPKP